MDKMELQIIYILALWITLTTARDGPPRAADHMQKMKECLVEEGVELNERGWPKNRNDPKMACTRYCMYKKYDKMNDQGDIIEQNFPENMRQLVVKCGNLSKEGTRCERAGNFSSCLREEKRKETTEQLNSCANETRTEIDLSNPRNLFRTRRDPKYACFHRCMLIKTKRLDEQNVFVVPERFKDVGVDERNKCIEENTQEDICLQAMERDRCLRKSFRGWQNDRRENDIERATPNTIELLD